MPTITVRDQTTSGTTTHELTLDLLTEEITVREFLRSRVYQEVQDFNLRRKTDPAAHFRGLVRPTDAEAVLNGYTLRSLREVDWKPQFEQACEAFTQSRIILLVDNHQPTELEERLTLKATSAVTFLRLTPLVGG